jgi:hypothetical protein
MRWNVTGQAPTAYISGEWKPDRSTLLAWTILTVPITVVGLLAYWWAALGGQLPGLGFSGSVGLGEILVVLAATFGLLVVHEAVHGLLMLAFGARPEFGLLKIEGAWAGFYTTAAGHLFSRRQYLLVSLAPFAVLSPLGLAACLLPFGAYLVIPFTVHLAGCIGDLTIVWHVLRQPPGTLCEDLRDGTRFWRVRA